MAKQSVAQNDNGALSTVQALLPWYCSGPRPGLSSTSLARAIERRAFTCLPDELVDCVLQRYVDFVHPQLPIVDLDHLLTVFDGPRNGMKISLLLWQALGTATIPFLTESDLAKAGLVTAEASLRAFFHRTKVTDASSTSIHNQLIVCADLARHRLRDLPNQEITSLPAFVQQGQPLPEHSNHSAVTVVGSHHCCQGYFRT